MSALGLNRLCAFCGGNEAAYGGRLGRMQGPFTVSPLGCEAVYAHHECAVWSPQTSQDEQLRLKGVGREVRRARTLKCSACGQPGASLGCRVPACSKCYHLPCAIQHACRFNFGLYLMACTEHAGLFSKEPAAHIQSMQSGPLSHLKLAGKCLRHNHARYSAAASDRDSIDGAGAAKHCRGAAAAGRCRRNNMTTNQLGEYVDAAKAAYVTLAEELAGDDSSSDDEALIARKDAKRLRKAAHQLKPTLLKAPPATAGSNLSASAAAGGPMAEGVSQGAQEPPAAGFASVGGLADVKLQLKEMVLLPLAYPALAKQLRIQAPRGLLLCGPPGTGKTAIVRALAAECAAFTTGQAGSKPVALFARKGTDCLGKYAGDAEQHLRLLFDMAAAAAPSIIFLDELDGLLPPRSVRSSSSDQIFASVVSVMLALMDGLKDRGQVLVIGATNRPDSIDTALRRPGRFDREVHFALPNKEDREAILRVQTARWQPQPPQELLHHIAAATEGWAGADLQSLSAAAFLNAVKCSTPDLLKGVGHRDTSELQQRQPQHQQVQQAQQGCQIRCQQLHSAPAATVVPVQQVNEKPTGSLGNEGAGCDSPESSGSQPAVMYGNHQHQHAAAISPSAAVPAADISDQPVPAAAPTGHPRSNGSSFLAALAEFVAEQQQQQQQGAQLAPVAHPVSPRPAAQMEFLDGLAQPATAVSRPCAQELDVHTRQPVGQGGGLPQYPQLAHEGPQTSMGRAGCALGPLHSIQQGQQQDHQHVCQQQEAAQMQQQQLPLSGQLLGEQQLLMGGQQPQPCRHIEQAQVQPVARVRAHDITRSQLADMAVLPCDWHTALAQAEPPASKREITSMAVGNPAIPLAAPLTALLLSALARIVLLLQSWLLLPEKCIQLVAAAADASAVTAGLAAHPTGMARAPAEPAGDAHSLFEQLLVQHCAVADPPTLQASMPGSYQQHAHSSSVAAKGGGANRDLFGSVSWPANSSCTFPCCLLLSGHGDISQDDLAAAVFQLLGSSSGGAAAVHSLHLPGMLLLGGGDAAQGLAAAIQQATYKAANAHTLVLYMPRIELWALEQRRHTEVDKLSIAHMPDDPAAQDTAIYWQHHMAAGTSRHWARTPWQGKSAFSRHCTSGFKGVISSSSSSSDNDSSSDACSNGNDSDVDQPAGSPGINYTNMQANSSQLPGRSHAGQQHRLHGSTASQGFPEQRTWQRQKRQQHGSVPLVSQQQQQHRLSAAWSVFEQHVCGCISQQRLVVVATSHLPAQQLPAEMQQVFGYNTQQQNQQPCHSAGHAAVTVNYHGISNESVQVCCPIHSSTNSCDITAYGAAAALSLALQRAAAAAMDQYCNLLRAKGAEFQPATSNPDCADVAAAAGQNTTNGCQGQTDGVLQAAPAQTEQQPDVLHGQGKQDGQQQQQQHQGSQQQPQPVQTEQVQLQQPGQYAQGSQSGPSSLLLLNDAQLTQARHLFQQVQQVLHQLGSLVLHDPRVRLVTARQKKQRRASNTGAPLQQHGAAALDTRLPLAAVCLRAMNGWYCNLDEFQAEFAAICNSIRQVRLQSCEDSQAAAAAAALDDMVGAGCRAANQQLQLTNPWQLYLLKAAAEDFQKQQQQEEDGRQWQQLNGEHKGTMAGGQGALMQQLSGLHRRLQETAAEPRLGTGSCTGPAVGLGDAAVNTAEPVHTITELQISAIGGELQQQQQGLQQHQQQLLANMQSRLQQLLERHLTQWQEKQQSKQQLSGKDSCAGAVLHAALQQYCRAARRLVHSGISG